MSNEQWKKLTQRRGGAEEEKVIIMANGKSSVNVEINTDVKEPATQCYGEQILDIIKHKNIPHRAVEVNAQGHIIVDKEKDPELYDWAVNG